MAERRRKREPEEQAVWCSLHEHTGHRVPFDAREKSHVLQFCQIQPYFDGAIAGFARILLCRFNTPT